MAIINNKATHVASTHTGVVDLYLFNLVYKLISATLMFLGVLVVIASLLADDGRKGPIYTGDDGPKRFFERYVEEPCPEEHTYGGHQRAMHPLSVLCYSI